MLSKKLTKLTTATAIASILALTGCAHREPSTEKAAARKERRHAKKMQKARAVNTDESKLIFKTSGMPMPVMYWKSSSAQACEGFEPVGKVFDSGRQALQPWIANMTEKLNKGVLRTDVAREQYVQPGVPIQVKGLSGPEEKNLYTSYSCGPIVTSFTPEKGRTYLVDFDFQGVKSCRQLVTDITDPDHPAPVDAQALPCAHPSYDVALKNAKDNFLKTDHEQSLDEAKKEEAAATSDWDKARAMKKEAAALDSLDRSQEALVVIDRALALVDPSKSKDLIATKAGILFNMNDPQAALKLLAPQIESTRKFADSKPPEQRASALSTYTEGFVTATFAHMQLEQWQDAINTLADAQSLLEGPSFYAYKSVVYRYIMARAQNPSLANAKLEQEATYYAAHDKSHYGALLRMWQGEDTAKEIATVIAGMSGADQQEALGESLFYRGVYAKFVKGNAAIGNGMLSELNSLAPYGSIEWIYGRRILQQ